MLTCDYGAQIIKENEEKKVFYKKTNYWRCRREIKEQKAQELLDEGITSTLKEAKEVYTRMRSNRKSLDWCRTNAQRYLDQLTPHEFKGLFRMNRLLFNSIEEKLRVYFEAKNLLKRSDFNIHSSLLLSTISISI